MTYYLDIRLRSDPEFPAYQLLNALYAKLHRALVQLDSRDIGISFPGHSEAPPCLGTHVRLHGPSGALDKLMATPWLGGMRDHLLVSSVSVVAAVTQHRKICRVQAKSNPERLRRRAIRRHGLDDATARQRIPDIASESLRLPFVQLGSRSTGQASFPLFIQHGPCQPEPTPGHFNSYGLSKGATIPWF